MKKMIIENKRSNKTAKKQKFLLQRVVKVLKEKGIIFNYCSFDPINSREVTIVIPLNQDNTWKGHCLEVTTELSEKGRFNLIKGEIADNDYYLYSHRYHHVREENLELKEFKFEDVLKYVGQYLRKEVPHEDQCLLPEEERDWR